MLGLTAIAKNPRLGTYPLLTNPTVALPSNLGVRREPDTRFVDVINAWLDYQPRHRPDPRMDDRRHRRRPARSARTSRPSFRSEHLGTRMGYQWSFGFLWRYERLFVTGIEVTLAYTLGTILLGLVLGLADRAGAAVEILAGERAAGGADRGVPLHAVCWCRSSGSTTRCR